MSSTMTECVSQAASEVLQQQHDRSHCLANTRCCTVFGKVPHQKFKHMHISYHITTLTPACGECINICILYRGFNFFKLPMTDKHVEHTQPSVEPIQIQFDNQLRWMLREAQ